MWTVTGLTLPMDSLWTGRFADPFGVPAHNLPTGSLDSSLRDLPTAPWTTLRAPAARPPWVAHTAHNRDDDETDQFDFGPWARRTTEENRTTLIHHLTGPY